MGHRGEWVSCGCLKDDGHQELGGWELVFQTGVWEGLKPQRPSESTSPLGLSADPSEVAEQQHKDPPCCPPPDTILERSWRERKTAKFKDLSKNGVTKKH